MSSPSVGSIDSINFDKDTNTLSLIFYKSGGKPARKITLSGDKTLSDLVSEIIGKPLPIEGAFYDFLAFTDKPGQSGRPQRVVPEDIPNTSIKDIPFFSLSWLRLVIRTGPNRASLPD